MAGEPVGTLFMAQGQTVAARKRWIGLTVKPRGRLFLDAGAKAAVEFKGRSLLAAGVVDAEGQFQKGDVVGLRGPDGIEFARGLSEEQARRELPRLERMPEDPRQELVVALAGPAVNVCLALLLFAVVGAVAEFKSMIVSGKPQRRFHLLVGQRPIAMEVVQVVRAVLEKDAQRFALALPDQGRVDMTAAYIGEAANV